MSVTRHVGLGKMYELFKHHATNSDSASDAFFVTMPRFDCSLTELAQILAKYLQDTYECQVLGQIWVREYHDDGCPHLHGLVKINMPLFLCYSELFQEVFKKVGTESGSIRVYGNIQPVMSEKAVKRYILKTMPKDSLAGPNMLVVGCYAADNKTTTAAVINKAINHVLAGGYLLQFLEDNSDSLSRYAILRNMRALKDLEAMRSNKVKLLPFKVPGEVTGEVPNIVRSWLIDLSSGKLRKPHVKRHLFITGDRETGKSSFLQLVQAYFKAYTIDNSAWFSPNYADGRMDVAIYDEFSLGTKKPLSILNSFLRGTSNDIFECKGGQITKTDKTLPAVFVSNHNKEEILEGFKRSNVADAFVNRFIWAEAGSTCLPKQLMSFYVLDTSEVGIQAIVLPTLGFCDYERTVIARFDGLMYVLTIESEPSEMFYPLHMHSTKIRQDVEYVPYDSDIQFSLQTTVKVRAKIDYNGIINTGSIKVQHNLDGTVSGELSLTLTALVVIARDVPTTPAGAITTVDFDLIVLPRARHHTAIDDEECGVCMGSFQCYKIAISCGHIFHEHCIRKYFIMHSAKCPICRQDYAPELASY
jgi:hypothetical protein